jgi:hypothetical protein
MADEEQPVELTEGDDGWPILLATRAAGQVAAQRTSGAIVLRGAASGNPSFDPASGRFAGKKQGQSVQQQGGDVVIVQQTRTLPQGVTLEQWERRQDIVRAAARTLKELDPQKAKAFLAAHASVNADQVNIDLFVRDVRAARIDDLVDIFDAQVSNPSIKLSAPKTYARNALKGLSDDEVLKIAKRLEGRGWDTAQIEKNLVGKIDNQARKTKLGQLYGESKPKKGKAA